LLTLPCESLENLNSLLVCSEQTPGVPEVHQDSGGDEQTAGGHTQAEGQAEPALLWHIRQGRDT
jgi:hypothetical protein